MKRLFHFVKLERFDDRFDFLHSGCPFVGSGPSVARRLEIAGAMPPF
jgi:hypothetical protein